MNYALSRSVQTLLILACLILAPVSVCAQVRRTLVFVVSRSEAEELLSNMDALLMIENGKFKIPYAEESEDAQKKFAELYYAAGKKYRVTFGGGEVGTATLKEFSTGCNNVHARALVEDSGKIPPHLSGLATDSSSLGKRPSSRRAPTTAEREAVTKLVGQIYRGKRVPSGWMRLLKTTNLTATDLNGDGKLELIGSFVLETKAKQRRDLLLIAEPMGAGFRAGLADFQAYKLGPEGFDSAINFVDQLDVDSDGIAEVFGIQHGFDAYGYNVYKKVNGRWRLMLSTTGDAC